MSSHTVRAVRVKEILYISAGALLSQINCDYSGSILSGNVNVEARDNRNKIYRSVVMITP